MLNNNKNYVPGIVITNEETNNTIGILSIILISVMVSGTVFVLIRKFSISKLGNGYIEMEFEDQKSLIDRNIREIAHLTKSRGYEIIVFEDLDRYKSVWKILVKLKELNLIVNNKSNKTITFVYLISDDTFSETNQKTKLLDASISTRYVLTSESVRQAIKDIHPNLSEKFGFIIIDHIGDMRVMHSISNDFNSLIDYGVEERDVNKVFAMMLYKNLYPTDFDNIYIDDSIITHLFRSAFSDDTHKKMTLIEIIKNAENTFNTKTLELYNKHLKKKNEKEVGVSMYMALVKMMIINEFITEDYYLSLYKKDEFYLTGTDKQFINNVYSKLTSNFNIELENINAVFHELRVSDFKHEYVINLSLINFGI